ncbi:MAG: DUF4345 family protein [Acidobacteriota bacterium]|mgnify:FL=1|nr:DUF4345 family protein [Acidobacteriota bacterium]
MNRVTSARALLWTEAALFALFGVGFLVAPAALAEVITGAPPGAASAAIDLRATYGGLALGLALTWLLLDRAGHARLGLMSAGMVLSCVALGRIVGMIVESSPNAFMWLLLISEVVFAGLSLGVARTAVDSP